MSNMPLLHQQQNRFTEAIRQPEALHAKDDFSSLSSAMSGAEVEARMEVYRNLVRHNLQSFVQHIFAVSQSTLPDTIKNALFEGFVDRYPCLNPLFVAIPEQFYHYVMEHQPLWQPVAPWLQALMHYEVLLLQIQQFHAVKEHPSPQLSTPDQLLMDTDLTKPFQLALPLWIMVYPYPVQSWLAQPDQIAQAANLQQPNTSHLLMLWRNAKGDIQAITPDPMMAVVCEKMAEQKAFTLAELQQAVQQVIEQQPAYRNQQAKSIIKDTLSYLASLDAFLQPS